MSPSKPSLAVNITDAARITSLSRGTLYAAIARGEITARKSGRRTLIEVAELEQYLKNLPTFVPTI